MKSQFEFKNPLVVYQLRKGSPELIHNDNMSDAKAIEFLKAGPHRIELFSKYPKNWKELIGLKKPRKSNKSIDAKVTIEAEASTEEIPSKKELPCNSCKKRREEAMKKNSKG